ncbi:MAG: cold shock domain-containing protein [Candidatus Altiarchaeota archaeon]|nr:cold shock domain-containing protein [Candidatus Altiarchaeota archaeon]
MTDGTVKFFNNAKNFGFITADDGKEYFVHGTGLKDNINIKEGDKVSFDIVEGERGPKAENVRLI